MNKKLRKKILEDIIGYHKTLVDTNLNHDMCFKIIKRYESYKYHYVDVDFKKLYDIALRYYRRYGEK